MHHRWVLIVLAMTAVAAGAPMKKSRQQMMLDSAISLYVGGEYVQASEALVGVFPYLERNPDQERAYRYLAYCYSMLRMTGRARAVFSAALERFPQMELDSLEAPPVIMSLFRDVKMGKRMEWHERYHSDLVDRTVRQASAILLLTAASGSAFGSGFLLSDGMRSSDADLSLWTGAGLGVVSAVLIPVSVVLLIRSQNDPTAKYVRVEGTPTSTAVVFDF